MCVPTICHELSSAQTGRIHIQQNRDIQTAGVFMYSDELGCSHHSSRSSYLVNNYITLRFLSHITDEIRSADPRIVHYPCSHAIGYIVFADGDFRPPLSTFFKTPS